MRLRPAVFLFAIFSMTGLSMNGPAAHAQAADAIRTQTPSGYPVPRFVSLKDNETNCRIGPSFDHPVRFVFKRANAPVLVVAESVDHWRKLRDPVGDECWVHQTTLKGQSHVLMLEGGRLRRKPEQDAAMTAQLGKGVLARIKKRKDGWLLVTADEARGWIPQSQVWGGDALAAYSGRN